MFSRIRPTTSATRSATVFFGIADERLGQQFLAASSASFSAICLARSLAELDEQLALGDRRDLAAHLDHGADLGGRIDEDGDTALGGLAVGRSWPRRPCFDLRIISTAFSMSPFASMRRLLHFIICIPVRSRNFITAAAEIWLMGASSFITVRKFSREPCERAHDVAESALGRARG